MRGQTSSFLRCWFVLLKNYGPVTFPSRDAGVHRRQAARACSAASEFSEQEARGPRKEGCVVAAQIVGGASGSGGFIFSRGKVTDSFPSQRGRNFSPGEPSTEKSSTGRTPFSPRTCSQGNALGALSCAQGPTPRAPAHPLPWAVAWRAPQGPQTSGLTYLGGRAARGGPALLLPPAFRPLARVGSAAGRLGSASRGAPGAESGARAAPGRSLGSRRARTHALCSAHLGVHCLHPETQVPHPSVLFLKKVLIALSL